MEFVTFQGEALKKGKPAMTAQFLQVQNITKNFGGIQALKEVSLNVQKGEVVGLIGPNGAGKSTLFNIIYGVKPTVGKVLFKGEDITGQKAFDMCHKGIARTFQLTRPFMGLSAKDNVAAALLFGCKRNSGSSRSEAQTKAVDILNEVKMAHRADTPASNLLFSERRRLELARALATEPELVLLDEVMAGLSSAESQEMMDILTVLKQRRGLTLLVIEHVMRVVMAICDRIIVLNFGRKMAEGAPQEVAHDKEVIAAYLGEECA